VPKNILIFSDGTGQAGGLTPDERISKIYKLYRATRVGPQVPALQHIASRRFRTRSPGFPGRTYALFYLRRKSHGTKDKAAPRYLRCPVHLPLAG